MTWKPDYATLADLKSFLRVTDTTDDAEFALWITAASRAIERRCNRQFGKATSAVARSYRRPSFWDPNSSMYVIEIDDVQDTTGLLVNGVAYATSGAVLLPENAPADGVPYERLGFTTDPTCAGWGLPNVPLVVTAAFGWTAVPSQVPAALRLQAARWNFRRDAPAGTAGSPDQGSEIRLLAKLDPDVGTTLVGLARRRVAF